MNPDTRPQLESVVAALAERLLAGISTSAATTRLAMAETRLAASSMLTILVLGIVLAVLAVVAWLLLLACAGYALVALGLPTGWMLAGLLLLHLAGCGWVYLSLKRLAGHLRFAQTRKALHRGAPEDANIPAAPAEQAAS